MIKIQLSDEQRRELEKLRRQSSSKNSEKALMVLLNAEGKSAPQIAKLLKRHPHTVRNWLKRYKAYGIKGLSRKFSPGRPGEKRKKLMEYMETILSNSPTAYGYQEDVWTVALIIHAAKKYLNIEVSRDTVIRALKSMGYTYKRPAKTVPATAPSPEEKRSAIRQMVDEIKELIKGKNCEIYSLDESHFSTQPYLVQGWFKKGSRYKIPTPCKRESLTFFGCLNLITQKFYWKKSKQSDSDALLSFLTQVRQRTPHREIVIILDNASIHRSKKVKQYLLRHKNIHLFYLPRYSPEYNPVEIFWKWIKPKVYGFSAIGGIKELVSRFRKLVWHFNNNRLPKTINFNFKVYAEIL